MTNYQQFEYAKHALQDKNLSTKEYEQELKKLTKKYKV